MAQSPPQRRCIGCRRSRPQSELLRFTRRGDGEVRLCTGPRKGRGAYVCPELSCVRSSWRAGRWERAFRARVRPCPDVDVFWADLLGTLVQKARFLYRSPLRSVVESIESLHLDPSSLSEVQGELANEVSRPSLSFSEPAQVFNAQESS